MAATSEQAVSDYNKFLLLLSRMAKQFHAWKRFWCPRDGRYSLADEGFLVDPESEIGRYHAEDVRSFESIQHYACLVLLGEPGAGKSTALKQEWSRLQQSASAQGDAELRFDLREFSTDQRLVNKVFGSPGLDAWKKGQHRLYLGLDSLDESLLRIPTINGVLQTELHDLDTSRLYLRIACRPADWPAGLEATLRELWGAENVGVYELVPLRKHDVVLAAAAIGIEGDEFLAEVRRLGTASLANRPVTLRFLLDTFQKTKSLPSSRVELYGEGCLRLAEEASESRRDARSVGKLTATQRLEVASRLAAVTILSNRYAFWMGLEPDAPTEDASVASLVGGVEGTEASAIRVTRDAILETLGTGLFNSRGTERLGWSHQSYAEFLAARYIHVSGLSPVRVRQLLLHPDRSGRVIPQLRETAAWVASFDTGIFTALLTTDPEVLLRSDTMATTDTGRAALAGSVLHAFETGQLLDDREIRPLYARLACPDLVRVLQPYLRDTSRTPAARHAAVRIAAACDVKALMSDMVALALDEGAPRLVRTAAACAVARNGDPQSRAALRPLALEQSGDDPEDELKGCGLLATWPDHLSASELLQALKPRKNPNLIGLYDGFLRSSPMKSLSPEDLPAALEWAQEYGPYREIDPLEKVASEVLAQALRHLDAPGVLEALAKVLSAQWQFSHNRSEELVSSLETPVVRQKIARVLYPVVADHAHGSLILMDGCLLRPPDVPWLIKDLECAPESTQRQLAWIVVRYLPAADVETFGIVLEAAKRLPMLAAELRPLTAARQLGSALAEEEKARFEDLRRASERPKGTSPSLNVNLLRGQLDHIDAESFFQVWALSDRAPSPEDNDEVLSGWRRIDATMQVQILDAAELYLLSFVSPSGDEWWRRGVFPAYAMAGHTAFLLLEHHSPERLQQLQPEVWDRWLPIIVLESIAGARQGPQQRVLAAAYRKAPERFVDLLDQIIDGQNDRWGLVVLNGLETFWTNAIAERLRRKLQNGNLTLAAYRRLMGTLLDHGDVHARQSAENALTLASEDPATRQRAVASTIELITHSADAAWSRVWPSLTHNDAFAEEVLSGFRSHDPFFGFQFTNKLSPDETADFFLWLHPTHLPACAYQEDDEGLPAHPIPRSVSLILSGLAYRGTADAVRALRRIQAARPELQELKWHLHTAEELTRRNTWAPLAPSELIRVVQNANSRFVRSGSDLLEFLIESLKRLEDKLQGVTPAAIDLWNEVVRDLPSPGNRQRIFRPKNELALSDYVKRHLESELNERGILVNREVEIRRPLGGAPGERTDIHVAVAVPSPDPNIMETITAIIEVKGIWNVDVAHAMETQLVGRYLNETGIEDGLYVVGWYACPQWDPDDYRSKPPPYASIAHAQQTFSAQARTLSNRNREVKSIVINASLR